jgi:hypothetical protein
VRIGLDPPRIDFSVRFQLEVAEVAAEQEDVLRIEPSVT